MKTIAHPEAPHHDFACLGKPGALCVFNHSGEKINQLLCVFTHNHFPYRSIPIGTRLAF
jgi:hypothetical protein